MPAYFVAQPAATSASLGTNNIAVLSKLLGNWIQVDPKYGQLVNPLLTALMAHGNAQLNQVPSGQRSQYDPMTNTVNVSNWQAIPHELAHEEQMQEKGIPLSALKNIFDILRFGEKGRYNAPGTLEYNADKVKSHQIIQQYGLNPNGL